MQLKRVVITGRGAVSPFGLGTTALLDNLWRGNSAVKLMPAWTEVKGLSSHIAAPVPEFDSKKLLPRSVRRTAGNMAVYAILAAKEAIEDSGISEKTISSNGLGAVIGSTTGSAGAYEEFYSKYIPAKRLEEIKSGEFFKIMSHSCAANVCLALGITGEQWAPVSACTSSSQAIGLGYMLIQTGRQKWALCGGADETHSTVTGVFDLLRAASCNHENPEQACRPFDNNRDGVVCGGGSGILMLEDYDSAKERGAKIYGEITGFGNVTDSGHIANPDKNSMARAMANAMQESGVSSDEIDYVNAHATATELGDIAEAEAISQAVNSTVPVSSLKGHLGHTLGAAGALELIGVLDMFEKMRLIPTKNLDQLDIRCKSANLFTKEMGSVVNTVVKNNFALGGVNTSLVVRRCE